MIDYARAGALRLQRSWMRRQVHAAQMLVEAETDLNQQCAKDPDIAEEVRNERKIFAHRLRVLKLVIADADIGGKREDMLRSDFSKNARMRFKT